MSMRTSLPISISLSVSLLAVAVAEPRKPAAEPSDDQARLSQVVARWEGGQVTVGDLETGIDAQSAFMRQRFVDEDARKALLDKSVRFELLAQEAARRGYDKKDSVIYAVKQNAVQVMIKKEFDEKLDADAIPAGEVKKYYDAHLDEFVRPAMRRASHVELATRDEAKAVLAEAKAADLRAFRELARNKSKDETSRLRGGDLRYFDAQGRVLDEGTETIDPALAKAAFALKTVGDTSEPVVTKAGVSIVKLTGQRPAHEESLAQADERIRMRLWRDQRQAGIDALLTQLRAQHKPEIHPELVDAIRFDTVDAVPAGPSLPPGFPQHKPPAKR